MENQQEVMQEATQEAPAQEVKTEVQEPETMQEVLDKYGDNVHFRRGEVRKGTIISKSENGYLIDVGFKCEGVLPMKEYTNHVLIEEPDSEPKPGDAIDVEIVSVRDGDDAQLLLSRWHNEFDKRWDALASALKENPVIEVKGVSKVKGGLMVNAGGLEAFIPVSQLTLAGRGANPQNFVGQTLTVKVLDLDKRKHRLVFSRR
ncbi:MAG: S1 RNA-binding domain-containing protein, partial [Synergistaceae bacterium]|nr:S1 RNA-binding domain-containing protein [Synergistaceae bacterium]